MGTTARKLRKNLTDAEQELWRHIRNRQLLGCKFRRQAPIGKYIVELDGGQHAQNQDYDHSRSECLQSRGFKVIRFWNHDILKQVEVVKEVIFGSLNTPHPDLPPQGGEGNKGLRPQGGKE